MQLISFTSNQKYSAANTFKSFMLATLIIMGSASLYGQDSNEPRYLLGNDKGEVHVSGFGSYILGFSSVDGEFAVYNGGGGAVLLNQTVYFGGYGLGLSTPHGGQNLTMLNNDGDEISYDNLYTQFGHGGFWIGYLHQSYKPVHFGASTKLGWGSLTMTNDYYEDKYGDYDYYHIADDGVFVVTPQVEVEMNLLKWFKINASAGYQFVSGVDQTYVNTDGDRVKFFDAKDYSSPMFNLTFSFGGFGGKR